MDVVKMRNGLILVNVDQENALSTLNPQAVKEQIARENPRISSYQEVPGLRHETKDVLQQLQHNIRLLEDLGGRLGFLMVEIRSVIRR